MPPQRVPSQTGRIHDYANVAALDAVSPSLVASCFLMPAGETLYAAFAELYLCPRKVPLDPLNILARPIYTKHFHRCCIKHVKGLHVSRHFNKRDLLAPHHQPVATTSLTRTRTAASGRKHSFRYLDTKTDKSSPGTGEGGRFDIADANSVSRCADIVRPVCSREVVTKRRYTTRNNQNFTSEKLTKTLPVDFGGFQTQSCRVLLLGGCFSDPLG
jgi:hypothetical protein